VSRIGRIVRRVIGRGHASPANEDPFANFRSVDGPRLVGGPRPVHNERRDGDPRIVVLLPHLDVGRMSGGPNTVFQVTARLLAAGLRLRYVATSGPMRPSAAEVAEHVRGLTGVPIDLDTTEFVDASGRGATFEVGSDDVLVATWWPTAHLANAALAHVRSSAFLYVVQDFEPGFYPWSAKSALAEATYAMPMRPIVNEPLLEAYLRDGGIGHFADIAWPRTTFTPAVDRAVFKPARSPRETDASRRLIFYARPRNPRNLFEIGLRALRQAAAAGVFDGSSWEFVAVGQEIPDLPLSDRHTLRSRPWMSYEAYGELLGSSDVLLSLMLSPHTSYPPLEMATAGGVVVTNTFGPKTAEALAAISPSILAAAPEVDALVAALREAVVAPAPSSIDVRLPATWDEALADVVPWVVRQVAALRDGD
jgi:beta-1,2-rhamnosyltransferase WsaF-like protein